MGSITRKKKVAIAKGVGTDIAAAFIAGAGTAATVGYVIITNTIIKQARRR